MGHPVLSGALLTMVHVLLNAYVPEKVVRSLQPAEPFPQLPLRHVVVIPLRVHLRVVVAVAVVVPFTEPKA